MAPLLVDCRDGIATLQFNRPTALNALDIPSAQAFLAAVQTIAHDASVRAVLLKGNKRAFVAGGDLATLRTDPRRGAHELLSYLHPAVTRLHTIDAPVIAQVRGVAAGAGLSLMLMCDFVLASDNARMNLAYINLGTSCDVGASWILPRITGLRHALEIALLGENVSAQDALRLGLVNRLHPDEELDAATQALVARLAAGPTKAYGQMRRLLYASFDHNLTTQLNREAAAFAACAATADLHEGIDAFFAKRKPQFQGR